MNAKKLYLIITLLSLTLILSSCNWWENKWPKVILKTNCKNEKTLEECEAKENTENKKEFDIWIFLLSEKIKNSELNIKNILNTSTDDLSNVDNKYFKEEVKSNKDWEEKIYDIYTAKVNNIKNTKNLKQLIFYMI